MIDYITNFEFNSTLGIYLFWVPLVFCIVFYTLRFVKMYFADIKNKEAFIKERADKESGKTKFISSFYHPSLTVGTIFSAYLASLIPGINIVYAVFDLAPSVFSNAFTYLGKFFDIPLVPLDKE